MPKTTDPLRSAVGALAEAQRKDRPADPEKLAAARDAVVVARLERAIDEALAPSEQALDPINETDRLRLAEKLRVG